MSKDEYRQHQSSNGPQSEIETMVNIETAKQALQSVQQFEDMIVAKLPEDIQDLVASDAWEMHTDESK